MEKLINVTEKNVSLEGMLKIPAHPKGLVLFAHGSGSSRFSPRNNYVADILNQAGLATLLIDLLSKEEDLNYETRFDIDLLTRRLLLVVKWLQKEKETQHLPLGLFGASTGAASALQVGAELKDQIKAIVSRGGRPDLAMSYLHEVTAPSLFIVGGNDFGVIELNEEAYECLLCKKHFEIVPHATHLFEEPGCLEQAASLAKEWFLKYLAHHHDTSPRHH